ncbi:MAG: hypothetical protein OEY44_04580, partial [Candidatus Peregrinibacteria bacterium]|nr:hypothetical protein [Candidatus Peregrinibacteria bacterium]
MVNLLKHKVALLVGLVAAILVGAAAYSGILNNLLGANLLSQNGTLEVSFDDVDGDGFQETFTLTCNAGSCAQLAYEFGIPGIEEYVPCSGSPCSVTANLPPSIESETYAFLAAFTGAADAEGLILDFTTGTVMDIALVAGAVVGPTPRSTPDAEVSGLQFDNCPTEAGTEAGCIPPAISVTGVDGDGDTVFEEVTFTASDAGGVVDFEIDFFDSSSAVIEAVYGGDPVCPIVAGQINCTLPVPSGTASVYFGVADTDDIEVETIFAGPFDYCANEAGTINGCNPILIDETTQITSDNGYFTASFEDSDQDGFADAVIMTCNFSNIDGGCPNSNLYEPTFTFVLNEQGPDDVQYCLPLYNNSDPTMCGFPLPEVAPLTGTLQYFNNLDLQDSITIDGTLLVLNADQCQNQKGFDGGCDLTAPTVTLSGVDADGAPGDGFNEAIHYTCTDDVACTDYGIGF